MGFTKDICSICKDRKQDKREEKTEFKLDQNVSEKIRILVFTEPGVNPIQQT